MPRISELPKANSVIGTDSTVADTEAGTMQVPFDTAAEYFKNYAVNHIIPPDIGAASNLNLLDNWYFPDPINQRGQAEYTGPLSGYSVDRWCVSIPVGALAKIEADGILLQNNSSDYLYFFQRIENSITQNKTFSVLDADGNLYVLFAPQMNGGYLDTPFGGIKIEGDNNNQFTTFINPGASVKLVAAKLELGSTQTLAHQDASGNWVLNDPPPNKALELAKCQRYYVKFRFSSADALVAPWSLATQWVSMNLSLPCNMRANPSFKTTGKMTIGPGFHEIFNPTSLVVNGNSAKFGMYYTGTQTSGMIGVDPGNGVIIEFDANL